MSYQPGNAERKKDENNHNGNDNQRYYFLFLKSGIFCYQNT